MLRITFLLVGLLAALSGFAQRLTGTVTTTDNQPVPFATVAVLNSTLGPRPTRPAIFLLTTCRPVAKPWGLLNK